MAQLGRMVGVLVLAVARLAAADPSAADLASTLDLAGSRMDLRFDPTAPAPGSTALSGVGSVGASLPLDTRLTLRMPATLGDRPVVGDTQVAASRALVQETALFPTVALSAGLALPTAPGSRGAHPGVKVAAQKKLFWGDVHAETELRTEGRELAPSYRTAVGTRLQLRPKTSASLDLVTVRPARGRREGHRRPELVAELGRARSALLKRRRLSAARWSWSPEPPGGRPGAGSARPGLARPDRRPPSTAWS